MTIVEDLDLTNYNSYKVKSVCKRAYFPETEQELVQFYKKKEKCILLGSGHNLILSQSYYDTNFVIFNGNFNKVMLDENCIEAEAGITMLELSELALSNSLSGVEMFYDIPSSLGGAVVMNAGASGEEIKDILIKVRYLDLVDYIVKEKNKNEISFEYRNSFFQKNPDKIVLKAWLELNPSTKEKIKAKMEDIKTRRWAKQPKEFPNAGSVFKRPKGFYVGAMIDELDLKGFSVGGAKISEKHSGFIINYNNATGEDILAIIAYVQSKVKERFNVDLEVEQRII